MEKEKSQNLTITIYLSDIVSRTQVLGSHYWMVQNEICYNLLTSALSMDIERKISGQSL